TISRFGLLFRVDTHLSLTGARILRALRGEPAMEDIKMTEETSKNFSRRNFIKGVIAAGAAVSSASYLFRTNALGQELAHGVSGNLCRCQDYDKILTALMRGAEHMRGA